MAKKVVPEQQLPLAPYRNQQLFSDYYLANTLPQRADWQALAVQAQPVMAKIAAIFKKYKPSENEPQTEDGFVKPVLQALGHTCEIQAPLATAEGTKKPDYIFYLDEDALNANKGRRLDDHLLQGKAFAVGDAKYWDRPLDVTSKKIGSDPFSNKNPSYQIAFYMQHSGLEWGILTNGRLWRLYHRATAHKLDHFYEVDLPMLLQRGDLEQFLYFYAFFHRSAFDAHPLGVSAILKESIDYAQGVGESLKRQVYEALCHVAQGFLDYAPDGLSPDDPAILKDIYDNSLILLYRLLFILYAEARDLLPLSESKLYREHYSLYALNHRITGELDAGVELLANSETLWSSFKQLFDYINVGAPPLKIATFNGGLFDPQKHPFLEQHKVGDAQLQQAMDLLARIDGQFIDYRDLSIRNLGTIYEGLLEYHLEKAKGDAQEGWTIDLLNDKGERKATGSYYTPDYIVKYIVEQTVGPVLQAAVESAPDEKKKVESILAVKVLDPSMGSGHFLVEATEYIARFIVENVSPEEPTKETDLAYWKRRVVQSCIYGVDLNPLAVELAKLSLWLSTVARDRPLSFLDHHLRTGNALLGAKLADFTVAPNGNGNGKARKVRETPKAQLALFDDETFRQSMTTAVDLMWLVESRPSQTVEQVKEQEQLYTTMRDGLMRKYGRIANLIVAVNYGVTVDASLWKPLVDYATGRILTAPSQFEEWLKAAGAIASEPRHRFFHWELEFPEVFFDRYGQSRRSLAGFDAVVGNPPWIRQEAFSEDKPALKRLYPDVYHGVADLYTYFVGLGNAHLRDGGRFGFIVPNKFVRANYGEALRSFLTSQVRLERLVDFGDLPVFREAVTYPMIVLTTKQQLEMDNTQPQQVKFTLLKQTHENDLAAAIEAGESSLPMSALAGPQWSLGGTATQVIIEKMRVVSVPLGEYVGDKILYGIKTGFNEAFVIDRRTRDRLIAEDHKSAEIIKPFVVGRDIKRYGLDAEERYIILTKIGTPIERYPAVFAHLQQYQPQLEARWDKGNHWWELRACDYYEEFEKPKIIFPDIADGCKFAFDTAGIYSTNTTYLMPVDPSQKYLVSLLNSSLVEFFFRDLSALIRGGYLRFFTQYVTQIPIRRITSTPPGGERAALTGSAIDLYKSGKREELLRFVEARLAAQPEQSDVVRDLLSYLAEQMIDLNRRRQQAVEDFMLGLESILSRAELQKINRLWTPNIAQTGERDAGKKLAEAQEMLGVLAIRVLELRDDIGALNEEQWKWLLKQRLRGPDLVGLVKVYRKFQPPVAEIDSEIAAADHLVDQIVYRLYGLTPEEIAIVESNHYKPFMAASIVALSAAEQRTAGSSE